MKQIKKAYVKQNAFSALVSFFLIIFLAMNNTAFAASIKIAPSYREVTITDQPSVDVPIFITNNSSVELQFSVETIDFWTLDESGGLTFNISKNAEKYGLKEFLYVDSETLVVPPNSRAKFLATIINNNSMSYGGHYGAVAFTLKTEKSDHAVPITQQITSLLFVSKLGGAKPNLKTREVKFNKSLFSLPNSAEIVVANDGNIHASPQGNLEILDPLGRVIFQAEVNSTGGNILPETVRRFVLGIDTKGPTIPGKYRVRIASEDVAFEETFILVPKKFIMWLIPTLVFIGGIFYVVRRSMLRKPKS
jgi:hypothetical protein